MASQAQNMQTQDAVEYNEFLKSNNNININTLFPYNPQQTAPVAQYNPRNWRALFSANSNLKSMDELKTETHNKTINAFINSISTYIK